MTYFQKLSEALSPMTKTVMTFLIISNFLVLTAGIARLTLAPRTVTPAIVIAVGCVLWESYWSCNRINKIRYKANDRNERSELEENATHRGTKLIAKTSVGSLTVLLAPFIASNLELAINTSVIVSLANASSQYALYQVFYSVAMKGALDCWQLGKILCHQSDRWR